LTDHYDAVFAGELPEKAAFNCCFPSVHDPYQAPPGKATAVISEIAAFDLKDGGSDKWMNREFREANAQRQLAVLKEYTTNINDDTVLWNYITTPMDIQNKYANMVKGGYKQGAYHPLQMGYLRPNQDCSHYRTPVKNLYIGGASVYPGGMIIWGSGYNCANAIADDFNIEKWWPELEIVKTARERGYMF